MKSKMKKIYESPRSIIVRLENTRHILYVSKEPEPTPSGEGVIDDARVLKGIDVWGEDDEDEYGL